MLPDDTTRLRFRPMLPTDIDAMADLLGDPAVMTFYPAPKTRDEAESWIAWSRRSYAEHGHGLWVIELHDGTFVGDCGLTWQTVAGLPALEVGYHVRPALQGQGLATEAALACRDLARAQALAPRLVAIIHPDNEASARVATKIGMRELSGDEVVFGRHVRILGMDL
jgi:RimJ/RimL family protein N-acetyltransferase